MDSTVAAWRREQRASLLARRRAIELEARQDAARIVAHQLEALVASQPRTSIGLYWPIKHEINLLYWAGVLARRGNLVLCLPVVVTRNAPLEYWRWSHGEPMTRGFWDIPIPSRRDVMTPDLMLAPLVGYDRANYRLGYGGGYFDRTLAAMSQRPMVVGVGYRFAALETIYPQPHDIPMDAVVTDDPEAPPPDWRHDAD